MSTTVFKIVSIVLFFFISEIQLSAQVTFKGTVTDSEGTPLMGASVVISGTTVGTTADIDGNYSLVYKGKEKFVTLFAEFLGFQTKEQKVEVNSGTITVSFRLEEASTSLNEVVVSAKSQEQMKREQPTSVTIMDMKQLEGRSLSFNDILNQASGVKVLQKGGLGTSSRMFVQGLDGKGIGIFVNGIPMGSSDEYQSSAIPTDMIKDIEIYKGVIPANLGGDGLSGAINIITKDFYHDHLEASYEIASLNTHRINVMGKKYIKDSGISLDANAFFDYSDNNYLFKSPYVDSIIRCDHNAYRNFGAHVGVSFTKQWFDMMSFYFGYDNTYKELQGGMVVIQSKIGHTHKKNRNFLTTQTFSKTMVDGKIKVDLSSMVEYSIENIIDTSSIRYNWDGTTEKRVIPGEWGSFPNNSDDRYWNIRELLNVKYIINDIHSINWNTSFKFDQKDPSDPLNDEYSAYSATMYASKLQALVSGLSYGVDLFDSRLKNELSGKYFYHHSEVLPTNEGVITNELTTTKNTSSSFGCSEALAWNIYKELTFKASVSKAVRIPVSYEIFGDGMMIVPSPNIIPEKSFNVNVGVNWLVNQKGYPNLRLDVNAFYMNVKDMIRLFATESMKMSYINLDNARILGIEGEINADFTSWLGANINFTYQDSRDNTQEAVGGGPNWHYDYRIPNMPYCFGFASIDLHKNDLLCKNSYSTFFAEVDYTHAFSYSWAMNSNSSLMIPEKWNVNIGIRQSFLDCYHISFEVHNLLDNELWSEFRYPLPGRSFHVKLRYTLN